LPEIQASHTRPVGRGFQENEREVEGMKGLKSWYLMAAVAQMALSVDHLTFKHSNMSSPIYQPKRKKYKGWQRQLRGNK